MENNKLYAAAYVKEINVEERTITAWASKGTLDRDTEIIRGKGWDTEDFQRHPVILVNHKRHELWVGKALWTKKSKEGLLFKAQFATTEAAQEAFQLIKDTDMAAFSVGFEVKEFKDMTVSELEDFEKELLPKGIKSTDRVRVYTKVKLLEISMVSLPANPTALLLAAQEGRIKTKSLIDDVDVEEIVPTIDKSFDGITSEKVADRMCELVDAGVCLSNPEGFEHQETKAAIMTDEQFTDYVDELVTLKEAVEKELAEEQEPTEPMITVKLKDDKILVDKNAIAQAVKEKLDILKAEIKESTDREMKKVLGKVV